MHIGIVIVLITGEVVRLRDEEVDEGEVSGLMEEYAKGIADLDSVIGAKTSGGDYVEIPSRSILYIRGLRI
jgi:hypothetical protein